MDQRARDVIKMGDKKFQKMAPVLSLWQEIALNFYPERADFTTKRNDGEEYADHLFSSYPVLARRELGNMLSEFLRPDKWFSIHLDDEDLDEDDEARAYLEHITKIQWRAMNDPDAGLVTALNQGDHDIATFGNAVFKYGLNAAADTLLYRNHHLRDCAWSDNAEGKTDCMWRKWTPTARQLVSQFGDKVSKEVKRAATLDPEKEFECQHVVLPQRVYDYKGPMGRKFPSVELWVEKDSEHTLLEGGLNYFCYVVAKWQTVANSEIGTSMATAVILPDGRTNQVLARTIREAGEKYVDPPMLQFSDAIRGDVALMAGGMVTADVEYIEHAENVLRPLQQDKSSFPVGFEIAAALKEDIRSGFFLDKIQLPETSKEMTATEVRRRIQEHIRAAAPISKPLQRNYNHLVCDGTFNLLRDVGAFHTDVMPDVLSNQRTNFKFRSPLDDLAEQSEAEMFVDVRDRILAPVAAFDPAQLEQVDWDTATRDAMRSMGFKQKWFKDKSAMPQRRQVMEQQAAAAQAAQSLHTAGAVGEQAGKAGVAIQEAQQMSDGNGAAQ